MKYRDQYIKLDGSSIVNEVIGTILFVFEEILHAKKNTRKAHKQIYAYKTLK